jgi:hypothetical protein
LQTPIDHANSAFGCRAPVAEAGAGGL